MLHVVACAVKEGCKEMVIWIVFFENTLRNRSFQDGESFFWLDCLFFFFLEERDILIFFLLTDFETNNIHPSQFSMCFLTFILIFIHKVSLIIINKSWRMMKWNITMNDDF